MRAPRPRSSLKALVALMALVVAGATVAGCSGTGQPRFGMPAPATRQSHSTLSLWQGTFIASMAVGALVWGLLIWSIVRYRRKRGDTSIPKQTRYHIPLEITYTAIPIVMVAVIFGFVVHAQRQIDRLVKSPAATVRVEGFQWGWRFSYLAPDGSVVGAPVVGDQSHNPTLILPEGSTVRLLLRSEDVIHSFYVPDFLFKRDLIPGVDNDIDLYIDKTGTFQGHCAEFCGLYHATMNFVVRAVPGVEFQSMLAEAKASGRAPTLSGAGA